MSSLTVAQAMGELAALYVGPDGPHQPTVAELQDIVARASVAPTGIPSPQIEGAILYTASDGAISGSQLSEYLAQSNPNLAILSKTAAGELLDQNSDFYHEIEDALTREGHPESKLKEIIDSPNGGFWSTVSENFALQYKNSNIIVIIPDPSLMKYDSIFAVNEIKSLLESDGTGSINGIPLSELRAKYNSLSSNNSIIDIVHYISSKSLSDVWSSVKLETVNGNVIGAHFSSEFYRSVGMSKLATYSQYYTGVNSKAVYEVISDGQFLNAKAVKIALSHAQDIKALHAAGRLLGPVGDVIEIAAVAATVTAQLRVGDRDGATRTLATFAMTYGAAGLMAGEAAALLSPFLFAGPAGMLIYTVGVVAAGVAGAYTAEWLADKIEALAGQIGAMPAALLPPSVAEALLGIFNPGLGDPIVIDLDGDGLELISLDQSAAFFGLDSDEFAERTGWVHPDDGILAYDRNGDGRINDTRELFGTTSKPGFAILEDLDSNRDGKISSADSLFSSLLIWRDINGDGASAANELASLSDSGISSISLNANVYGKRENGNRIERISEVTKTDGSLTNAYEVFFAFSEFMTSYEIPEDLEIDPEALLLPSIRGFGELPSLWISMMEREDVKEFSVDLINHLKNGEISHFVSKFDDLLFKWANVEGAYWFSESGSDAFVTPVFRAEDAWRLQAAELANDRSLLPITAAFIISDPWTVSSNASGIHSLLVTQEMNDWLDDNNYILGNLTTDQFNEWYDPNLIINESLHDYGLSSTRGPTSFQRTDVNYHLSGERMAFLQKMMGQEYSHGENFINTAHFIFPEPSMEVAERLAESYKDTFVYYMTRYLVDAGRLHALSDPEGEIGGWLAPFAYLELDGSTDRIVGDVEAFAAEWVELYRLDGRADSDALDFLANFKTELPSLLPFLLTSVDGLDRTDVLDAFGGATLVAGGGGADTLTAVAGSHILGLAGDDTITGSVGADVIVGGAGNDILTGGIGADVYVFSFGFGIDTVAEGNDPFAVDRLVFGSGLYSGAAVLTRSAASPNDLTISFADQPGSVFIPEQFVGLGLGRGVEEIEFSDGVAWGRTEIMEAYIERAQTLGSDHILGFHGSNNYLIVAIHGSDVIEEKGDDLGVDQMVFGSNLDISSIELSRTSGSPDDLIVGFSNQSGTLTIKKQYSGLSKEGFERFVFEDGTVWDRADIFNAYVLQAQTAGNDTIFGYYGSTDFAVNTLQGSDTIFEFSDDNGVDTLKFGPDLLASNIRVTRPLGNENDLNIAFVGQSGVLTLRDQFWGIGRGFEQFQFADGVVWDRADIFAAYVSQAQTVGNDLILGVRGASRFVVNALAGHDTIVENSDETSLDRLVFGPGLTLASMQLSRSGTNSENLVIGFAGQAGSLLIKDHFVPFGQGVEEIEFADGTVLDHSAIFATYVAHAQTAGNDTVVGASGSTVYSFANLAGADTLIEGSDTLGTDRIIFSGVGMTSSNLGLSRSSSNPDDLTISFAGYSGTLLVKNQFRGLGFGIEEIEFADGTVWNKTQLAAAQSALTQTAGDDTFSGTSASDVFVFEALAGNDTLIESYGGGAVDRLLFGQALTVADIVLTRSSSYPNDITLGFVGQNGTLTLKYEFSGPGYGIEEIQFADGTLWDRTALFSAYSVQAQTSGNDTVVGIDGSNTYTYASLAGADTLIESYGTSAVDRLKFTGSGMTAANITLSKTNMNDITLGFAGQSGTLTLKSEFSGSGYGIEEIEFADGTIWDRTALFNAYSAQAQTAGNDEVIGIEGSNTYTYTGLAGVDTLTESYGTSAVDRLKFTGSGMTAANITLSKTNMNDITLGFAGQSGTLTLKSEFSGSGYGIEEIEFADGTIWDRTALFNAYSAQAQTAGNDTVVGIDGSNTYSYGALAGTDTLIEGYGTGSVDRLKFTGANMVSSNVALTRLNSWSDHVVLSFENESGSIVLQNQLYGYGYGIEEIEFADGTIWNKTAIQQATMTSMSAPLSSDLEQLSMIGAPSLEWAYAQPSLYKSRRISEAEGGEYSNTDAGLLKLVSAMAAWDAGQSNAGPVRTWANSSMIEIQLAAAL